MKKLSNIIFQNIVVMNIINKSDKDINEREILNKYIKKISHDS